MDIVFSYWYGANARNFEAFPEMAALSNHLAKECGYTTTMYTDKIGKELLGKIEYDNFEILDQSVLDKFPKTGWNLGKVLVGSLMDKPFFHIDNDFLMYEPLSPELEYKNILYFHSEPWMDPVLKNSCKFIKRHPSLIAAGQRFRSYSAAIFGGQNYKAFNLACKNVCNFALENASYLDALCLQQRSLKDKNQVKHYLYLSKVLEQLWVPQILINQGHSISTLLTGSEIREIEDADYSSCFDNLGIFDHPSDDDMLIFRNFHLLLNREAQNRKIVHYRKSSSQLNYHQKILLEVKQKNLKF